MRRLAISSLLALFILTHSCVGDDSTDNSPSTIATLSANIDDSLITIRIVEVRAVPKNIESLDIILSTVVDGTASDDIAESERQIEIFIDSVSAVTIDTPVTIGFGSLGDSMVYEDETDRFLGSSGSVTFSKIGDSVDDEVAFSFNVGFVNNDTIDTKSAQIESDDEITVTVSATN